MQTYRIDIRDRMLATSGDTSLVRTSRGIDQIEVTVHDAEWLGFELSLALSIGGTLHEVPVELSEADEGWVCAVPVPDSILEHDGALGVALHGVSRTDHIITAYSAPLIIEYEGDD